MVNKKKKDQIQKVEENLKIFGFFRFQKIEYFFLEFEFGEGLAKILFLLKKKQ